MRRIITIIILLIGINNITPAQPISQDERMQWWREARFGMFIHWGLYSVLAGEWEGEEVEGIGEWIMRRAQIPVAEYRELARDFNPVKFNARDYVALAKNAGMKYITITSKHHDGFSMFESASSKYNIVDATPYGKDVIKALAEECHKQGLKICFYYSQSRDWNEPDGLDNDWDFPKERDFQNYLDRKVKPQLMELLTQYGPVGLIWFDTPMNISKEQAQSLKDLVRKLQPDCIISGRLGGGVETDYMSTGDNVIPATVVQGDWEVPATLNNTWGFKKNDHDWKSHVDLTRLLFDITAKGGNYLLNIGPDATGLIPKESVEILNKVGDWMKIYSGSIYATSPNPFNVEFSWGNITQKPGKLYLGIFDWPSDDFYLEGLKNKVIKVYLLSDLGKTPLAFEAFYNKKLNHNRLKIELPLDAPDEAVSVVVLEIEGKAEIEQEISQNVDGSIVLHGASGKASIDGLQYNLEFTARGGGAAWTKENINLTWDFKVENPGLYRIDLITTETGSHGNPVWQGGHKVKIETAGQSVCFVVKSDFNEYNPRTQYWKKIYTDGGTINLEKRGKYSLSLETSNLSEGDLGFTFQSIVLTPVKQ